MNGSLFTGRLIALTALDLERDCETLSRWSHDPTYGRLMDSKPVHPLAPETLRKLLAKRRDQSQAYWAIRTRSDDRLVGTITLAHVGWSNGISRIELGIGDPAERRHGYGGEALALMLRYAFDELNLHRLAAVVPAYNEGAIRFLEQAGFVIEARRRQALNRGGRRWDAIHLGLLRDEWSALAGMET